MSIVSDSGCYYFNGTEFVRLPIPNVQVIMIRGPYGEVSCVVTPEHLYFVTMKSSTEPEVTRHDAPDYRIQDVCPLSKSHSYTDNSYCVILDDCGCARVYDTNMRVKYTISNSLAICSSMDQYTILTSDGTLFTRTALDSPPVRIRVRDNLLLEAFSRMSCRSVSKDEYVLALWDDYQLVRIVVSTHTDYPSSSCRYSDHRSLGYEEQFYNSPLAYVESNRGCMLVFMANGEVLVDDEVVCTGCVRVVRTSCPHITWLGVKGDGTYDIINPLTTQPNNNSTPISLTNTDVRIIKDPKSVRH